MVDLYNHDLLSIFIVSVVAVLGVSEIARRRGARVTHGGKNISTLEAAVLTLLALMIGFTFAMALTRALKAGGRRC
jgi:hypothetical protein